MNLLDLHFSLVVLVTLVLNGLIPKSLPVKMEHVTFIFSAKFNIAQ